MNMSHSTTSIAIKLGILVFVAVSVYGVAELAIPDRPTEQSGDPLDIRGTNIIVLRTPRGVAFERILIQETGRASRIPIPYNSAIDAATDISMTTSEVRDVQTFRVQWCRDEFSLLKINQSGPVIDVAVLCDGHHIKQAAVAEERLPPVLKTIMKRLPRLPP
jgi:hypothetical protein